MAEENKQTVEKKIETKKVEAIPKVEKKIVSKPLLTETKKSLDLTDNLSTKVKPLPVDKSEKKEDKKESDLEKVVRDKPTEQSTTQQS